jgi:hypothetical protein
MESGEEFPRHPPEAPTGNKKRFLRELAAFPRIIKTYGQHLRHSLPRIHLG